MGNTININDTSSTRLISIDEFDFKKVELISNHKDTDSQFMYEQFIIKYDGYDDWMIIVKDVIIYDNIKDIEIVSIKYPLVKLFQYIINEFKKKTGFNVSSHKFGFTKNYDYIRCTIPTEYSTFYYYINSYISKQECIRGNILDLRHLLQISLFTNDKRFNIGINFKFNFRRYLQTNKTTIDLVNNMRYLTNIDIPKSVCILLEKYNMFIKGVREIISDYLV